MNRMSPKYLLAVLSLTALALVALISVTTYSIRASSQKTSELLNLADEAAQIEILAQSIRVLQNDKRAELEKLDNFTLTEDDIVPFIESIEETGRNLGLETNIASLGKIEDKKAAVPTMMKMVVEIDGSWESTFTFLKVLENMPYRLIIDESTLDKSESTWKSRIVLSAHLFK